ncbi:type II toxin-antitoxin system prevent-host-death family antitoxin (plasmid) [Deinococcus taeanensis]|uniref:type II toxin-antitoxin system prevent-host-death family antitoxin n=1 Tax=Deinococcus taeanensis TaxID=2737050 RepID=UPI001CDC55EB|nr:type II toxin-antitoxin system prevent-host-death family antitoxin [Deinococcus taeanensis]UBV45385.1 type II toxin-antitoxin system prevent-host-death family antitoxin [Deinococcus taeanensis]
MPKPPLPSPDVPLLAQVSVSDARAQWKGVLRQVERHSHRVIITHHDNPLVAIVPLSELTVLDPLALSTAPRVPSHTVRADLRGTVLPVMAGGTRTVILRYDEPVAALVPVSDLARLKRPPSTPAATLPPGASMRKTTIITFFSHAGGVGKTSSCRDIGYELAAVGHRVLLIDLDPQANLTDWLGVDPEDESSVTMFDALVNGLPLPAVHHVHGLDLIPSGLELARIEAMLTGMDLGGVDRLKKALRPVVEAGTYDFILIDTPPTLGKPVLIALFACHEVIIPVSSRNKGLSAVKTVHDMVNTYREYNPGLNILSHLITQRGSTNHSKAAQEAAVALLPNISGPIKSRPAIYDECQVAKQPVGAFAPGSEARQEVQAAVRQILGYLAVPA